jgi:hypothetical protein
MFSHEKLVCIFFFFNLVAYHEHLSKDTNFRIFGILQQVNIMLHGLIPSSVEAALPFAPNYSRQDLFSEWVPEKAWKDGSNPLIAGNCYEIPGSYVARKRRKKSAIMSSVEPETDKAPTNAVNCDPPVVNDDGVRARTIPSVVAKSKSGMGVGSITARINISNIVELPDSELEVSGDDLSIRELCTSVLRSHGLLAGDCPVSNSAPIEVLGNIKNNNFFQSCELCGNLEKALNMLLCDHCEEAFHLSCCNLNMEMLPTDLWFCPSCSKLNHNVSQETSFLKTCSISWWNEKSKLGPIASMLKYPEAHTSRVRIGTSYQATVPEWSDQLSMYVLPVVLNFDPLFAKIFYICIVVLLMFTFCVCMIECLSQCTAAFK